ncbi:hypothetical protein FOA52_000899 [Chlamydomonas sp. UWO 241]|nr:hypothetical protein FOA52_000899 [Chlamydomonas sp. UWO 241]
MTHKHNASDESTESAGASFGRRQQTTDTSQYRDWNFLKGDGPSSSAMYYVEEKSAWKPGWKSRKPEAAIDQTRERMGTTVAKTQRQDAIGTLKADRLSACASGFNPVSGLPATDPWAHQKPGQRPQGTIVAMQAQSKPDPAARAQAQAQVFAMRHDRLANDGMAGGRPRQTAADCLRWGA